MVYINFSEAEVYLNHTLLFGYPSLLVVGKNGIGKTELLRTMIAKSKRCRYVSNIDYGGLKQQIALAYSNKQDIIAIPDLKNIIMRKRTVSESTLGYMSSLMSEGIMSNMSYSKDMELDEGKEKKKKIINFIIPATKVHLAVLIRQQQYDFLNRFLILEVERSNKEWKPEKFELNAPYVKKYNKDIYRSYVNTRFKGLSPRFNTMLNNLARGLVSMGVDYKDLINKSKPLVFDPDMYIDLNKVDFKLRVLDTVEDTED